MKIIKENVVTTSLLEHEGEFYVRTEDSLNVYWNKELEPHLYEYFKHTDVWQARIKCMWRDCDLPDLERKYQQLKSESCS